MAKYEIDLNHRFKEGVKTDYDDAVLRDGKVVGEIGYNELTDCCMWWHENPDGTVAKGDFADSEMSPADLIAKVREAYGE